MKSYAFQISSKPDFGLIGNISKFTNSPKVAAKLQKRGGFLWENNPFKAGGCRDDLGTWHFIPMAK